MVVLSFDEGVKGRMLEQGYHRQVCLVVRQSGKYQETMNWDCTRCIMEKVSYNKFTEDTFTPSESTSLFKPFVTIRFLSK